MSLSISFYLSLSIISRNLSLSLSVCQYLSVCSLSLSLSSTQSLSISFHLSLSVFLSVSLHLNLSVCLSEHIFSDSISQLMNFRCVKSPNWQCVEFFQMKKKNWSTVRLKCWAKNKVHENKSKNSPGNYSLNINHFLFPLLRGNKSRR